MLVHEAESTDKVHEHCPCQAGGLKPLACCVSPGDLDIGQLACLHKRKSYS